MGTPEGPQGAGKDRNTTETPKSHPCCSREELDITGGQSPCDTGTDPVPASPVVPPASPTKVPFSCGGEEPSSASAAAPRQEPAPRRRGRAAPRDAKGQGTKGAGGRRSGTVPGSGCHLRPRDGPRSTDGSLQMDGRCQQVCSAWPFPRPDPSPSLGWGNAQESGCSGDAVGDPQARVTLGITKPPSPQHTIAANFSSLHLQERLRLPKSV